MRLVSTCTSSPIMRTLVSASSQQTPTPVSDKSTTSLMPLLLTSKPSGLISES